MARILTPEAQAERDVFERWYGDCTCFQPPPCCSCLHPGNPRNQEEDPDAWEPEALDLDALEQAAYIAVANTIERAAARHLQEMSHASR